MRELLGVLAGIHAARHAVWVRIEDSVCSELCGIFVFLSNWKQPSACTDKSYNNKYRLSTCYGAALEQQLGKQQETEKKESLLRLLAL